jgi:hypothetical protein
MKKTLLVILSMLLIHGIAACGGGGTSEDATQDEPTPEVTHDPDAEAEGTPQEEAVEVPPEVPIEVVDVPPEMVDVRPEVPTDVPPANGVVGDPCVTAAQCGGVPATDKQCLTSLFVVTFEGGYCSAVCTTDADCDASIAKCVNAYVASYCLQTCDSAADCRTDENYGCAELPMGMDPGTTYCIPNIGTGDF